MSNPLDPLNLNQEGKQLLVKLLHPEAVLPTREHSYDAGVDLRAIEAVTLEPGARATVGTGIAVAVPIGMEGRVCPRSGLASKHGITVLNAPGIIDAGYTGEVKVILINLGDKVYDVKAGERIAQFILGPVEIIPLFQVAPEVELPSPSGRGANGIGSTGNV